MMLPIISVLIGIGLMYYIRQKRAEKEMDEIVSSISPSNDSNENIGTRDLCIELLRQLNCEVRIEHDDIYFTYQNEKFMIEASNDSVFITIWDLHWDMVDSENVQDVENMKKAVNRTNHLVHNTVLYILYKEEKSYYILSKLQCLLIRNIPNAKAYLAATLDDFFRTKQCYSQVLDEMDKEVLDGTKQHSILNQVKKQLMVWQYRKSFVPLRAKQLTGKVNAISFDIRICQSHTRCK